MGKEILAAAIRGNEAKALRVVEPFHGTGCHSRFSLQKLILGVRPNAGRSREKRRPDEYRASGYNGTVLSLLENPARAVYPGFPLSSRKFDISQLSQGLGDLPLVRCGIKIAPLRSG